LDHQGLPPENNAGLSILLTWAYAGDAICASARTSTKVQDWARLNVPRTGVEFAPDSPLEEDGFELSVPPSRTAFETASEPRDDRPASQLELDFDDRKSAGLPFTEQAGPGNDINAGSPGFQKAPTRGPASLVAIRRYPAGARVVRGNRHLFKVGGYIDQKY
jgi:hypothetical protein